MVNEIYLHKQFNSAGGALHNDAVYYDNDGTITEWYLWSDHLQDYMAADLEAIKKRYPKTFEDVQDLVRTQADIAKKLKDWRAG